MERKGQNNDITKPGFSLVWDLGESPLLAQFRYLLSALVGIYDISNIYINLLIYSSLL
jgi:hypothetical protein